MSRAERDELRAAGVSLPYETRALAPSEIRDPTAATKLVNYQGPGTRQIPEWDGDTAIREAYLSSVIVYAAVKTRAFAFSGCPLRAVLPGKGVENHDPNAPLARLFGPAPGAPNPQFSSRKMWANAMTNKIVTGKFAWELEKPQGAQGTGWAPVAAWPLIARVFYPLPTDGGSQLFTGFKYGRGDRQVTLSADQVFYVFDPSLTDMRQPSSALQSARYDITADVLQSIYDVAFLRNDARPAGLLVHEAFAEASSERAFRQQFDANHRGPQNANRIAFAEMSGGEGAAPGSEWQWINMGITQKDAQMLATHNEKAMRICIAVSVPMSLLDASGRTFNNAGLEERNFWLDTMMPDLRDMEDEINMKLAWRLGPHVAMFDTSHVASLQAPSKFISTKIEDLVDRKIISPQEARQELEYPLEMEGEPLGTGSTLLDTATIVDKLVAAGWSPQEAAEVVGLKPPAAKEVPDPKAQAFPTLPGSGLGVGAPAQPQVPAAPAPRSVPLAAIRTVRDQLRRRGERKRIWQQQHAQTAALEAAYTKGMQRLFARQREKTLERLNARRGRWAKALTRDDTSDAEDAAEAGWASDVFDRDYWTAETEQAVTGLFESLYAAGGASVAGMMGMTFDITDPRVEAQISRRASQLAAQVTGTTFDAIQSVILSGIQSGAGIPAIAQGVEDVFAEADSRRATLIARTETIRASADGAMSAWDQAVRSDLIDPSQYGKTWIADESERTCDECLALDGEVVGFDEQFSNGEDGPPDHPDCRCAVGVDQLDGGRGVEPNEVAALLTAVAERSVAATELVA